MTQPPHHPEKIHGLKHVWAAATYSAAGVKRLWAETAFRHEVIAAVLILGAYIWAGVSPGAFAIGVGLILITFALEALNTALEEIVDHISPDWSLPAKHAKDLGSFAVLCGLIANGVYAVAVIFS